MPAWTLVDRAIRYGFQVLGAIVILVAGALVARWTGRLLDRRLQRHPMEPPMRRLLVRAAEILVLLFAVVAALDKFGFQIAPLVAGIGVAGVGVGLARQGLIPAEDTPYRALVERFRGAGVTRPIAYHEVRVLNGAAVAR